MTFTIFIAHPSALLTNYRPHGDGLVAHGFIQGLAERGHTLHIAASRVALRGDLPAGVHLHALGAASLPEPLSRLQYMHRMRRLFASLRRTVDFDLVHQLNPVEAGLTLALADAKQPVVLGPYVPAWPPWSEPGGGSLLPRVLDRVNAAVRAAQQRNAAAVLLSTPAATAKLAMPVPTQLLVRELSHGIDEQIWRPGNDAVQRQDILFLANLEWRKGIFVLLEAFARLATQLPGARLLVGGDGSQTEAVRSAVLQSDALRRVKLLGHVPREQAPELMRECTVYCLPSFGEPFGMSALEAMASAKPVVAADAGGLRHLVDARGGRRVPPGDPVRLSAALCEVLASPELQRRMGAHNRSIIERRYTWTRVIDRLEDVYAEAVAARRR